MVLIVILVLRERPIVGRGRVVFGVSDVRFDGHRHVSVDTKTRPMSRHIVVGVAGVAVAEGAVDVVPVEAKGSTGRGRAWCGWF